MKRSLFVFALIVFGFILSSNEYLKEDIKSEIFSYEAVDFVRSLDGSSIKVSDWPLSRKINALAGIGNPNKFCEVPLACIYI